MDKRRRKRHQAHKGSLAVCHEHRTFLEATPGGENMLGRLERAVGAEAARFADQESCRMHYRAAVDWCRKARRTLYSAIKHVTTVSRLVDGAPAFARSRVTNDEQLIGRVEAVLEGAAPHAEALVLAGVQPGLLEAIAADLASFKAAKAAATLAVAQYTEASGAFDRAHEDARHAIAVLEGILITSEDAPVGAHTSLRKAKRIGPRVHEDAAAEPESTALLSFPAPQLQMTGTDAAQSLRGSQELEVVRLPTDD
jgi:hypothetical protein